MSSGTAATNAPPPSNSASGRPNSENERPINLLDHQATPPSPAHRPPSSAASKAASADPVDGHTLEWATASPPPVGNFAEAVAAVRSERPLLDIKEAQ